MSCTSCRVIRRTAVGLALGGMAVWKLTGAAPFVEGEDVWRGFLYVALALMMLSVMLRMRQMAARWRK